MIMVWYWRYQWHDGQQVIYEEVSGLAEAYRYVWGNGIDEALLRFGNGNIWYLDNQLGSVMALTDNNGQIIESYRYDVYGSVTAYDASGQQISMTNYDNRYLFTGREYNWHTGLYHYRARTYHPRLGRFLSRDPLEEYDFLLSLYSYCACNPLKFRDPSGMFFSKDWWLELLSQFFLGVSKKEADLVWQQVGSALRKAGLTWARLAETYRKGGVIPFLRELVRFVKVFAGIVLDTLKRSLFAAKRSKAPETTRALRDAVRKLGRSLGEAAREAGKVAEKRLVGKLVIRIFRRISYKLATFLARAASFFGWILLAIDLGRAIYKACSKYDPLPALVKYLPTHTEEVRSTAGGLTAWEKSIPR